MIPIAAPTPPRFPTSWSRRLHAFLPALLLLAGSPACSTQSPPEATPPAVVHDHPMAAAEPASEPSAEPKPAPTEAESDAHRSELEAIADLLIDDRPREAKAAAEDLLAVENLPADVAMRAWELLDKAEERLSAPPPPAAPAKTPAPMPMPAAARVATPPPPFPDASFRVVEAQPGEGFTRGRTGTLRIDETGLSFVAAGSRKIAWGVPWSRVVTLTADEGLWDTLHPLVLRQHGAPPHYLALADRHGAFPKPDRLLAAFQRALQEAQSRTSRTGENAKSPPGKEGSR